MNDTVRILLVSGSTRDGSTNTAVLATAQQLAPQGVTTVLYQDLVGLPAFIPGEQEAPESVRRLREQIDAADAVLFCTPEYAGALPGSFKNLIDWTVGTGELYRKPVAWINVAAEPRGEGALGQLRAVLGYVDAEIIEPACVRLTVAREMVGPDGLVADTRWRERLAEVLRVIADKVSADQVNA